VSGTEGPSRPSNLEAALWLMNFFRNSHPVSPRKHATDQDVESLLPDLKDTPPKAEPLQDSHQQICGLPVQLVSGVAYCTGGFLSVESS
jgi:hypothetical protein